MQISKKNLNVNFVSKSLKMGGSQEAIYLERIPIKEKIKNNKNLRKVQNYQKSKNKNNNFPTNPNKVINNNKKK